MHQGDMKLGVTLSKHMGNDIKRSTTLNKWKKFVQVHFPGENRFKKAYALLAQLYLFMPCMRQMMSKSVLQ